MPIHQGATAKIKTTDAAKTGWPSFGISNGPMSFLRPGESALGEGVWGGPRGSLYFETEEEAWEFIETNFGDDRYRRGPNGNPWVVDRSKPIGPDGKNFPWGKIRQIHTIGRYQIVEHERTKSANVTDEEWAFEADENGDHIGFSCYADGRSLGHSAGTLEMAIITCICIVHDSAGQNTRAPRYIKRMIGLEEV